MLECLGVIFVAIILYTLLTSDEIYFSIRIDGKEVLHYEKKDTDEENDKKNKKDLK